MATLDDLEARVQRLERRMDALGLGMGEARARVSEPTPATDENIWNSVLPRLKERVNRFSFYTWFRDLTFVSDDGTTVRLRGPNSLHCDFFQHRYAPLIHEVLAEFGREGTALVVRPD